MIVVTGATGNVGRPLVQALANAGEKVVSVTRKRGDSVQPPGVANWLADLADPDSLRPALDGADAAFLLLPPDVLLGNGPAALFEVLRTSGVPRVVLLSSQAATTRPDAVSHAPLRWYEHALRESGLDWTILRPSGFYSNVFAWADSVRSERTVLAPFGEVALPLVDPADVGEVAAAALLGDGHAGGDYLLTGPELISPRAQAEAIGAAVGARVAFVELTREQAAEHMTQFMPAAVADGTLDVLGRPLPTEQQISPDVAAVLGRPATPFATWATRNAAIFR